ncbi:MAG TPA: type II secretion system protein [Bacillota bacterium]|nr:type II secretion system protein [Bacillota bacterium]
MPTLETGKKTAGYTLFEVVAVIALIGFVSILALPRIILSAEQVEVGYIGRLIQSDFRQIKNESLLDPSSDTTVTFTKTGYSFNIGDHRIIRNFQYQFTFELPEKTEEETNPSDTSTNNGTSTHTGEDTRQIETNQLGIVNDKTENHPEESDKIHFSDGELANEVQFHWQTKNFDGSFTCKTNGVVEWKYQRQHHAP